MNMLISPYNESINSMRERKRSLKPLHSISLRTVSAMLLCGYNRSADERCQHLTASSIVNFSNSFEEGLGMF